MCALITASVLIIILIAIGLFMIWSCRVQFKQIDELTRISKEKWEEDKKLLTLTL